MSKKTKVIKKTTKTMSKARAEKLARAYFRDMKRYINNLSMPLVEQNR